MRAAVTTEVDKDGVLRLAPRQLWLTLVGAMMVLVLAALDQNIVNTALPRIVGELGGMEHISWVVTAFMLTATATTPLYGKLSDILGRKPVLTVAVLLFLAGSMLCGQAGSMTQLIIFRGLQGLGAGGLMTLSQTVIGDVVAPRDRGRYQALFTGAFAASSVAGPILGGAITTFLSWRWVFYVNLPIGALALFLLHLGLSRTPPLKRRGIDYPGAGLLAGITTIILLVLSWGGSAMPWGSPLILGLAVAALSLILLFVLQERRTPEPIIGLALFRNRTFASCVAASGMMSFAMQGSTVFLPLYFQLVLGMSAAHAGMMLLPQVACMLVSSILGGQLMSRLGTAKPFAVVGIGLECLALSGLAVLAGAGAPAWAFLIPMGMLGLGMGVGMPVVTTAVQNSVAHADIGIATSSMSYLRSLGGAAGVALSGSVMAARLGDLLASSPEPIDIHGLMEHGIDVVDRLTGPVREAVTTAYGHAIAGSFTLSGFVMLAAFLLITTLPSGVLQGRKRG
jgi:EmrB/QacA subfamily drug resistance transporter